MNETYQDLETCIRLGSDFDFEKEVERYYNKKSIAPCAGYTEYKGLFYKAYKDGWKITDDPRGIGNEIFFGPDVLICDAFEIFRNDPDINPTTANLEIYNYYRKKYGRGTDVINQSMYGEEKPS